MHKPLTALQEQVLETFISNGCKQTTADELGMTRSTVRTHIHAIERKGMAPWLAPVPEPPTMVTGKTTVQYNSNGQVVQEWRRMAPRLEVMEQVVDRMCDRVDGKGKLPKRKPKKTDRDDILYEIAIYDAHVGLYADEQETLDQNFTTEIAAARMVDAVESLAKRANRPKKVVLTFGGDMLHADNRSNKTEASGHVLDVDTRYARVAEYVERASIECVEIAATIGAEVEMVILEGNHSYHSEIWLARVLNAYYRTVDHVTVRLDRSPRKHMIWGNNLLVWTHGDKVAAPKWAQIVAAEFPQQWGQTKYRHMKCGHIHHQKAIAPVIVDEQAGLLVEFLPALCATDQYHAAAGYVGNQKGATSFEYHLSQGCISRFFNPA